MYLEKLGQDIEESVKQLRQRTVGVQAPELGNLMRAQTPRSWGRASAIVITLPFMDCPPRGVGLFFSVFFLFFF